MAYSVNMINNLIKLYNPVKFGFSKPFLFIIEYHNFHIVKLPIKKMDTINKFNKMDSGCDIIKSINSTSANPKIAKGPKIKLKTGSSIM